MYLLPAAFLIAFLVISVIYWASGRASAKEEMEKSEPVDVEWEHRYFWPAKEKMENPEEKATSYACGEDMPSEELKVDLERFFIYTVYFLIFDVLVFILATSFNVTGLTTVVYCTTLLMSIVMFLCVRRDI